MKLVGTTTGMFTCLLLYDPQQAMGHGASCVQDYKKQTLKMNYYGGAGDGTEDYCVIYPHCEGVTYTKTECSNCDCIKIYVGDDQSSVHMSITKLSHDSGFATLQWECPDPDITNVTGYWIGIGSASTPQEIEYQVQVKHSEEVSNTESWGVSVTKSASKGFSFAGFGATESVSGTTSQTLSKTHASLFSLEESLTYSYHLHSGQVWQWWWEIEDSNGGISWVKTSDVTETAGLYEQPCCLPGYYASIKEPMGSCIADPQDEYQTSYTTCK